MIHESKVVYGEDGSYIVFANNFLDTEKFGENTFIVHMEGTPKVLFKEWMRHKEEFLIGRIFFCTQFGNFFKNHSEEILPGVWEYTGDKYR